MNRIAQFFRTIRRDSSGVTAVEFGLVAPTFIMMLLGIFDLGYNVYARAILDGAVQKAARDATLESGPAGLSTIDARVQNLIGPLGANATFAFDRKNYLDFADVGRAEDFEDQNDNGVRDAGECYTDENENLTWDADVGKTGVGGARDVVLYSVSMTYDRKFPLYAMIGQGQDATIVSSTVLRNQPYGDQTNRATSVRCD
ncbi:MAG: TadE/TadG family type IV pilus assembly protein [Blastomonas sp.]